MSYRTPTPAWRSYKDPEKEDILYKEKVFCKDAQDEACDIIKMLDNKDLNDAEKKERLTAAKMEKMQKAKLDAKKLLDLRLKDYGLFVRAQQASRIAARALEKIKKFQAIEQNLHLQMKVESVLSEAAAETIDMNSPEAKIALERLSVAFPSVREEAEKAEFNKGAMPVPVEPAKADPTIMSGELRSIYELYKKYDLSETQLRVMSILANPKVCIEEYGDMSKSAIANMLGISEGDVSTAFDKRLMATLYNESLLSLRMSKMLVDGALIASAADPDPRHNADRTLYYRMIGALQDKSDQTVIDKIPREKKMEVISKTIAKLTRDKDEAIEVRNQVLERMNNGTV